jgi:hypothetical protein
MCRRSVAVIIITALARKPLQQGAAELIACQPRGWQAIDPAEPH